MLQLANLMRLHFRNAAVVNDTYSKAVSSSQTGRSDEHQPDKNSPCGHRNIAAKASVYETH